MSSWNLLGKGYEKIPLLASANLRGDYRRGWALPGRHSWECPASAMAGCSWVRLASTIEVASSEAGPWCSQACGGRAATTQARQ
ncbi:hypothetical protein FQJ88_22625 [Xanthomonas vasicola]|nr:hypothetical protein FQJ96_22280 [Xanthomonas vasicola]TWQ49788.1 hypothetical protein FQJ94_22045 [Xanthomonas vasicola]TWQ51830.1 hypothetical protein FQJ93_22265 [Xanthomonas vasicola]TWQ60550.1 hypothetical protein FQJ90_22315 [Xanthomonas vasicola]TWQ64068.1 hypothetical protein FQJ91_22625 [Xanthomonas vasicola]